MNENYHYAGELEQMQSLPLEIKIRMTKMRIRQWVEAFSGSAYISFSGGKDSTVLLAIAREVFPDIPAVYCDTGLEYPEIRMFVKRFDNVVWLRPKMNFREVIRRYGYPVASKETAKRVYEIRHYNLSDEYKGKLLGKGVKAIPLRWRNLLTAPFEVSAKCCDVMKKRPFHQYEKTTGSKPIVATMAEESLLRRTSWLKYGCNAFDRATGPQSRPLSFWRERDVLEYLVKYDVPYASVYGDIIGLMPDGEIIPMCELEHMAKRCGIPKEVVLKTTACERTGCMFCMYGCHQDSNPNRFQRMAETHPIQYQYCMKPWSEGGLGLDAVLSYIGVDH